MEKWWLFLIKIVRFWHIPMSYFQIYSKKYLMNLFSICLGLSITFQVLKSRTREILMWIFNFCLIWTNNQKKLHCLKEKMNKILKNWKFQDCYYVLQIQKFKTVYIRFMGFISKNKLTKIRKRLQNHQLTDFLKVIFIRSNICKHIIL